MRLPDVDTGRLSGLKYRLVSHFKLVVHMVRGGISSLSKNAGPSASFKFLYAKIE